MKQEKDIPLDVCIGKYAATLIATNTTTFLVKVEVYISNRGITLKLDDAELNFIQMGEGIYEVRTSISLYTLIYLPGEEPLLTYQRIQYLTEAEQASKMYDY